MQSNNLNNPNKSTTDHFDLGLLFGAPAAQSQSQLQPQPQPLAKSPATPLPAMAPITHSHVQAAAPVSDVMAQILGDIQTGGGSLDDLAALFMDPSDKVDVDPMSFAELFDPMSFHSIQAGSSVAQQHPQQYDPLALSSSPLPALDLSVIAPLSASATCLPPLDVPDLELAVVDPSSVVLADLPPLDPPSPAVAAPAASSPLETPVARATHTSVPATEPVGQGTGEVDADEDDDTTLISTATRKSSSSCKSLPATLEYPKNLIPLAAPILPRRGAPPGSAPKPVAPALVKSVKRTASTAALDEPSEKDAAMLAELEKIDPKEAKRIKNTLSARQSRARKAAKIEFLENKVNDLEMENERLQRQVQELTLQLVQQQQRQLNIVSRVHSGAAGAGTNFLF